jgi:hypothetical protein
MAEQSSLDARPGIAAGNSSDRTESPKLVPDEVRTEPGKAELGRVELGKAEPARLDGGVADAFKVDPPRPAGKIFVASTTNRIRDKVASPKADPVKTDAVKADASKVDMSKVDMSKVEIPRVGKIASSSADRSWDSKSAGAKAAAEAGKTAQQSKQDASKAALSKMAARSKVTASRLAGQITASLPNVRALASWWPRRAGPQAQVGAEQVRAGSASPAKRRMSSLAAMAAIAAAAGAIGGVLATTLFPQFLPADAAMSTSENATLQASVARIDADMQALKSGTEQGGQQAQGQGGDSQTAERLDRLERAEADSSAKIVRLNEATERLRVAVQSTPGMPPIAPASSRETTGSAAPSSGAAAAFGAVRPAATPKPVEVGKLPVVQGWSLRDVNHGLALIEGRNGFYEVYAGDPIPGLGRVDSIRRQDGRWVVVTTKGLVVSR